MGQIKLWASLVLISLFAFAIIGFSTKFAEDNNAAVTLDDIDEASFDEGVYGANIQAFSGGVNDTSKVLEESTISPDKETLDRTAQFKGGVFGAFDATKNVLKIMNKHLLGGEQGNGGLGIFLTALISFLVFMIIMYLYKTLRGNPD